MNVRVFADAGNLCRAAADLFVARADAAIGRDGRFTVALSGGQTPLGTYELLALSPWRDQVAWDRTHVFWGDERCVPEDDPRCNAFTARRVLLDRVPIPAENVHPIACDLSADQAAHRYEALLRSFFPVPPSGFDLVLLGLGADGHTASLFPGSKVLAETEQWVAVVHPEAHGVPRVTLTVPFINRASAVVFLVAGTAKAGVLGLVLEGGDDGAHLPARFIRPAAGGPCWLVDEAAAAELRGPRPGPEGDAACAAARRAGG
jgi:6-phosphogluconolactonase